MCPQAAVEFHAGLKILGTEVASLGSRGQCEWTADSYGVPELERGMGHILLDDKILGNSPSFEVAPENELGLQFPLLFASSLIVCNGQIFLGIVIYDLEQSLVGAIDVLEFHVEYRIDPVLAREQSKAVLPAVTGK